MKFTDSFSHLHAELRHSNLCFNELFSPNDKVLEPLCQPNRSKSNLRGVEIYYSTLLCRESETFGDQLKHEKKMTVVGP